MSFVWVRPEASLVFVPSLPAGSVTFTVIASFGLIGLVVVMSNLPPSSTTPSPIFSPLEFVISTLEPLISGSLFGPSTALPITLPLSAVLSEGLELSIDVTLSIVTTGASLSFVSGVMLSSAVIPTDGNTDPLSSTLGLELLEFSASILL